MDEATAPLPPLALATRVGPGESTDPYEAYRSEGAAVRRRIEHMLPADWSWTGKRVLDFGCGSARVLRQFLPEADTAEFWGCDIDAASIAWIDAELSPPLQCLRNDLAPPLELDSGAFDLVYATSVFTHIDTLWAEWLLELHRILRPGGVLVASFLGAGMWEGLVGGTYAPDRVGIATKRHWTGPDAWVFHSEWWLREHWGRAFGDLRFEGPPRDEHGAAQITHSYVAGAKRAVELGPEDLRRRDPAEPRELASLETEVAVLRADVAELLAERQAAASPAFGEALRAAVRATPLRRPAAALRRAVRARRAD